MSKQSNKQKTYNKVTVIITQSSDRKQCRSLQCLYVNYSHINYN